MSFDLTGLPSARKRWPKRHDTLPAAVQTVFEAWDNCLEQQQDDALSLIEGFAKPPGRFTSKQKSRDLTLLRSPLPSGISVHPLSAEDVAVFFGETPPPIRSHLGAGTRFRTSTRFVPHLLCGPHPRTIEWPPWKLRSPSAWKPLQNKTNSSPLKRPR